jgi:dolichol-phosphate mannosyltransferase
LAKVATDEMTALELPLGLRVRDTVRRTHLRFLDGVRKPHNWKQLIRFLCVGTSGYVVNVTTFAVCLHVLNINYRISFVIAFLAGCSNNFWWNRHWTFDARHEHPGFQAVRFLFVSVLVSAFAYGVLELLLSTTGMDKVLAEALSYIAATPISFIAQKLWSFRA